MDDWLIYWLINFLELFPYLDFVRSMVEGYGDFQAFMGDTSDVSSRLPIGDILNPAHKEKGTTKGTASGNLQRDVTETVS